MAPLPRVRHGRARSEGREGTRGLHERALSSAAVAPRRVIARNHRTLDPSNPAPRADRSLVMRPAGIEPATSRSGGARSIP